jgi:rubredoxin
MSDSHSAPTAVRVCPHCTTLDIAHVGDTETSRWLECRECGYVWNHSLPAPPRATPPAAAQPRRWTQRDDPEPYIEEHGPSPREADWTTDRGWPRDRWPVGGREERDRER